MSRSVVKKIAKRQRKYQNRLINNDVNISSSKSPTKHLAICNVGQINGLSEEVIYSNFNEFGQIEQVKMLAGKSYCFLTFTNVESAICAMDKCNGQLRIAQDNKPVYLIYMDNVPYMPQKVSNILPPGLIVLEDFISESEENQLLALSKFEDNKGLMKHRQVKHFGYEFLYDINNIDRNAPLNENIPKECDFLWKRLSNYNINFHPDQLTINHYNSGQGIPAHIDTHNAFTDKIVSLSLCSSILMDFEKDGTKLSVFLPQRSLLVMTGESRYLWSHCIQSRKFDFYQSKTIKRNIRISFTFREILPSPFCNCNKCHSKSDNKEEIARKLETVHVHHIYETIATHFNDTRQKPWPNVVQFIQTFQIGDILFDCGCGNGKYFNLAQNRVFQLGCDTSFGLIEFCKNKGIETINGNCLNIPLRNNIADGVISIAVIHHLANEERRLEAIREMVRILKINGRLLIYVWAKEQLNKNNEKSSYLKQDKRKGEKPTENEELLKETEFNLPIHTNRTQFKHKDLLVPWKLKNNNNKKSVCGNDDNTFLRFYHVFEEGELVNLCEKLKNILIEKHYYDQGNWCVILRKV